MGSELVNGVVSLGGEWSAGGVSYGGENLGWLGYFKPPFFPQGLKK